MLRNPAIAKLPHHETSSPRRTIPCDFFVSQREPPPVRSVLLRAVHKENTGEPAYCVGGKPMAEPGPEQHERHEDPGDLCGGHAEQS